MKLNVGLITHSAMWEQLLEQEGVPFSHVEVEDLTNACSVLVVNRLLKSNEVKTVEQYLRSGGAVLGYADHLIGVCGTTTRRERIDYLVGDHEAIFSHVSLVDTEILADIPREANCMRTQHNTHAVFAGKLAEGYAVLLPFDAATLMCDVRAVDKNFYSDRERLPSERVSLVSKGELRHLMHDALQYLHHARNLPYVQAWYFPDGRRNLFAFRIDSDKGSRKEVDELYHVALENDVGMSWFLDVKSHEEWLQHFAFLTGQEVGVHCYEHRTYETYEGNLKNIAKAKHKLEQVGISSPGFTAPFGVWNTELAKAIDTVMFEYSSEFSFAYDSFPMYPSNGQQTFLTPQIPVHPICIGSLQRVGYSETRMKEYFRRVIDAKLLRYEPLFFYHHPTHRHADVVRFIFQYVRQRGIGNTTMLDFARWWKKRLSYRFAIEFENGTCTVQSTKVPDDSLWLRIIRPDKAEGFVRPSREIDLNTLEWEPQRSDYLPPSDIRRIREFDPRGMLGDLFSALSRKLSERKTYE